MAIGGVVVRGALTSSASPSSASPSCSLSVSPSSVAEGGSVTLQWSTLNATSFSINQNVGAVSPIASGSKSVAVPSTQTYTGTVTGFGGTAYCGATVTVITSAPTPVPSTGPTVTSTGYNNGIFYVKTTESQSGGEYRTIAKGETFSIGGVLYKTVAGTGVGNVYLISSAESVIKIGDAVIKSSAGAP